MKTIYKYSVPPTGNFYMPPDAVLLSVAVQDQRLVAYAITEQLPPRRIVDVQQTVKQYRLLIIGTGHDLPPNPGKFLGTHLLMDGRLALHVFDPNQ